MIAAVDGSARKSNATSAGTDSRMRSANPISPISEQRATTPTRHAVEMNDAHAMKGTTDETDHRLPHTPKLA